MAIAETRAWWIGFSAPGVVALLSMLMWKFLIRHDSIFYLVDKHREYEGFTHFQQIYKGLQDSELNDLWEQTKEQRN